MVTLTTSQRPLDLPITILPVDLPFSAWRRNVNPDEVTSANTLAYIDADHLCLIFSFLDGYCLAKCTCVCNVWRKAAEQPRLWQNLYLANFAYRTIPRRISGQIDWKQRFVKDPHLRFDGLYFLHVSYWSKGTDTSGYRIHRFSYYRYLRFFNDGSVHYALLNDPPSIFIPKYFQCRSEDYSNSHVFQGRYKMKKVNVSIIVEMRHMVAGIKVKVASTIPGACNRLQFHMLASLNEDLQVDCNFKVPAQEFFFIPIY